MSGSILKKRREELGLEIREVAAALRLRHEYLSAIEEDLFDRLPAPVYTLGYIRSYAKYLGVDPTEILKLYSGRLPAAKTDAPLMPVVLDEKRKRPWALYITALSLVLAAGIAAYVKWPLVSEKPAIVEQKTAPQTNTRAVAPDVKKEAEPHTVESVRPAQPTGTAATVVPAITPTVEATAPSSAPEIREQKKPATEKGLHRLSVTAAETSWIYLRFNNGSHEELTMRPGDVREWVFSEGASLKVGNAGGVQVMYDGRNQGPVGKKKEVVTLRFPLVSE